MSKVEIAQNEQILLLPQCFHLFSVKLPTFIEPLHVFARMFQKSSAAGYDSRQDCNDHLLLALALAGQLLLQVRHLDLMVLAL